MQQFRRRTRGSGKTFHGSYGTIDPARTVHSRGARHVANPGRRERAQYISRRSHSLRGGRGRRRPISPGARSLLIILAIVVLVGLALAAFLLTRPASAIITSSPDDAMILFDGSVAGTGTLSVEEQEPGSYRVNVHRTGFEPIEVNAELKRGRRTELRYVLKALPQEVSVVTHPAGAKVKVETADVKAFTGAGPFSAEVPSGAITITVKLDGYNTLTREYFLDSPLALEYYLDPEGQVLRGIGMISTAGAPKGVSITHDGREAWTSILNGPPSIQIFDPRTGATLGEVDLGEYGAVEVIFNRAGTLAYTSQMETAKCFEIDVATRRVLREFETGSSWTKWVELSPDEKMLYASNWSGDDVSVIDLATGKLVKRIGVSDTPRGMYATGDGKSLYVAGFDSGELQRIDLASGAVTTVFSGGGALRHVVADEKTGRMFISDMSKNAVWLHDMNTGATTVFAQVDEKPNTIELTPDDKMLFVSCRGANNPKSYYVPGPQWGSILVFDAATGAPLDALIAGNQPTALDISADGKLLVCSDFLDNRLRVYEIPSYETFAAAGGGRYEAHKAEIAK